MKARWPRSLRVTDFELLLMDSSAAKFCGLVSGSFWPLKKSDGAFKVELILARLKFFNKRNLFAIMV